MHNTEEEQDQAEQPRAMHSEDRGCANEATDKVRSEQYPLWAATVAGITGRFRGNRNQMRC